MALSLYPQPSLFDDYIKNIRDNAPVPSSAFYVRRPTYVPWTSGTTTFILETDEPTAVHQINLNRDQATAIVPGDGQITLELSLLKGANRIEVVTPTKRFVVTVSSTAVESWMNVLGSETYLSVGQRLADIQANLVSPWSTRVSAHLIPYNGIFLPSRMPKVHQTRLAVVTSLGQKLGTSEGVLNVARSVSYTTPPVTRTYESGFNIPGEWDDNAGVTHHATTGEANGRVLDIWTHNQCFAAHNALMRLSLSVGAPDAASPKPMDLLDKTDRQLILRMSGGDREVHNIDPLQTGCQNLDDGTGCDDIRIFLRTNAIVQIMQTTPQLPFDIGIDAPLLFGYFDEGGFWDSYMGHGLPGIGGGDDMLDTVDLDDPFGTGFRGVSTSGRLDGACLDSQNQAGRRMTMVTAPLTSTFSPVPPLVEGNLIEVDGDTGAPDPIIGATQLWIRSSRNYMYEGDHIRFEDPDQEVTVVSAFPVLDDPAAQIIKSDTASTFTPSGFVKIITASAPGFFEQQHITMGIEVDGLLQYTIADVSADGSTATLVGNPVSPGPGPFIVNIYRPIRDRTDVSEPAGSVLLLSAGSITWDVTIDTPLVGALTDGEEASYRVAPRVSGVTGMGLDTITIMSDLEPKPSDILYFDSSTPVTIMGATETGTHPITGLPLYEVLLNGLTPAAYSDDDSLFVFRLNPCWEHGDPVTPLVVIKLDFGAVLAP